ncbi:transposase [Actinomadura physcomitrii]|nr:transposase [Actinomadura physcomitrii]
MCRDSGGAYAEAVRTAAPDAVQVADRFHVWRNVCEAVEKCIVLHRACLPDPTGPDQAQQATSVPQSQGAAAAAHAEWEGVRVAKRRERHAAVHELLGKGAGISAIAEALGLDRKTVRRYAHAVAPEDLAPARGGRRGTRVDPFLPYLHERRKQGCTDAARLFTEIRERGYTGSQRTVRRHLQAVRASGKPAPKVTKQLSVRRATHLITSHPDHMDENATLRLKKLLARCPELDTVAACVAAFAQMNGRPGRKPAAWLEQAEATGFPPPERPGQRHPPRFRRGDGGIERALELRPRGRQRQSDQADQKGRLWARVLRTPAPPDPSRRLSVGDCR